MHPRTRPVVFLHSPLLLAGRGCARNGSHRQRQKKRKRTIFTLTAEHEKGKAHGLQSLPLPRSVPLRSLRTDQSTARRRYSRSLNDQQYTDLLSKQNHITHIQSYGLAETRSARVRYAGAKKNLHPCRIIKQD
jgi:hypothetical protein